MDLQSEWLQQLPNDSIRLILEFYNYTIVYQQQQQQQLHLHFFASTDVETNSMDEISNQLQEQEQHHHFSLNSRNKFLIKNFFGKKRGEIMQVYSNFTIINFFQFEWNFLKNFLTVAKFITFQHPKKYSDSGDNESRNRETPKLFSSKAMTDFYYVNLVTSLSSSLENITNPLHLLHQIEISDIYLLPRNIFTVMPNLEKLVIHDVRSNSYRLPQFLNLFKGIPTTRLKSISITWDISNSPIMKASDLNFTVLAKQPLLKSLSIKNSNAFCLHEDCKGVESLFPQLSVLELSYGLFLDVSMLSYLSSNLRELDVSYVTLGDESITILCNRCPNLMSLKMRQCKLSGWNLNLLFEKMTKLQYLDISNNNFEKSTSCLKKLSQQPTLQAIKLQMQSIGYSLLKHHPFPLIFTHRD